jgi:hypothetical protein
MYADKTRGEGQRGLNTRLRSIACEWTRPITEFPLWMLTGVDQTPWVCTSGLAEAHPVFTRRQRGGTRADAVAQCQVSAGVSSLDLCTSAEQVDYWRANEASLKVGHVAKIPQSDARLGASDRSDRCVRSVRFMLCVEPNGSISWGLLFRPHGRLLLTLLAISIENTP